jgi:hypothetical protein
MCLPLCEAKTMNGFNLGYILLPHANPVPREDGGSVRTLDANGTYTEVTESNVSNNAKGGRQK